MAYQNNGYNGSYRGNGSQGRNYNNGNNGYNNSNGQQKAKNPQRAIFEIKGSICKTREGGLFTNSRNGSSVFFNLMVGNRKATGNVDQNGQPIYEQVKEFYRVCASGQIMNNLVNSVNVPYTSLLVRGNILNVKTQDGRNEMMLFVREFNIEKVPSGNNGSWQNGGGQGYQAPQRNYNAPPAQNNYRQAPQNNQHPQQQAPKPQPSYNYEDRPHNNNFEPNPPAQEEPEYDTDIPF